MPPVNVHTCVLSTRLNNVAGVYVEVRAKPSARVTHPHSVDQERTPLDATLQPTMLRVCRNLYIAPSANWQFLQPATSYRAQVCDHLCFALLQLA